MIIDPVLGDTRWHEDFMFPWVSAEVVKGSEASRFFMLRKEMS